MPETRPIRVLIVEDELITAEVLKSMLDQNGYSVAGIAPDGRSAVELTVKLKPDVVLLDLFLPILDGFSVAREIALRQPTPIVVLTGDETTESLEKASKAGAGAFLIKPVRVKELDRAITVARARFADLAELRRLNERLQSEMEIRNHREKEIRESERWAHNLFNVSPDAVFIIGPEGRFIESNPVATARYGYTRDEFLTMSPADLVTPDRREQSIEKVKTTREISASFEWRHVGKDGTEFPVEIRSNPILFNGKACILGVVRDLTEQKREEKERRASEDRYRELFSSMLEGFALHEIITDEAGTPVDYRFLDVNPAFCQLTGLSREIVGRTVRETIPGIETKWIETYGRVALTGDPIEFEDYAEPLDRHFRITAFRNAPGQFACFFEDITKRRKAEAAQQESEIRFRQVVESSPDAIFVQTGGRFAYVNPEMIRLTGARKAEDLLGTSVIERFHPDFREQVAARIRRLNLDRAEVPRREETILSFDGSPVEVEVSAVPFQYKEEYGALVFMRDIRDRKKAEAEQERLAGQLQQAMKMEAVGRLAGGIAHDFNNLLTGINGHIDLLLIDLSPADPIRETLEEIKKAGESAISLTRQLLAFSRKQIIEPKVINLNDLIRGLHSMLVRLIGEDIDLSTIPGKKLGAVSVDPGQFEQILVNLAVNARDAMPNGGNLIIETANIHLDEEYCHRHSEVLPGDYVMLAVSDTGMGMNEEIKTHLFEPFFTTKPKERGTGLGLATIFGTVKQAGGSIEVYSEEERGTTFKIYLPLVAEPARPLEKSGSVPKMMGGGETILVVEDEVIVRDLATKILKRLGYKVLQANNGPNALLLAQEHPGRIDLLMTDVVMPGMNGRQLVEHLQPIHPETRVLYTSGYTENVIVHHGVLENDLHFIGKPYSPRSLAQKIREVLDAPFSSN